ncbi:hypothetical protein SAMN06265361_102572 [Laceyella tengchongensis]|uniref:Uncharacterized protein n=1 Tax=Laceyella tengchongensis TaxID=574699 RepID=A0AA45WMM7_9BACL|nr:hypothetical protein SAMN06265361_102572 [Laceyella tengchongensis]
MGNDGLKGNAFLASAFAIKVMGTGIALIF